MVMGIVTINMNTQNKVYPEAGHHYCYVLTPHGWHNQGMVPDNDRQPFIEEYKRTKGTRVAFVPYCFEGNNLMTDSQIYSFSNGSF